MSSPPRASFARAATPGEIADLLRAERERIGRENQAHPAGRATCRALSERCDQAIQRLFALARPEGAEGERIAAAAAVLATGGYGRRELCGWSDVDVTFLVAGEEDAALDATVRQLFLWLMEVFGQRLQLKVGYGYRTLADLAQIDHQSQTALLDARLVCGSHGLFDRFSRELARQLWPAEFVRLKVAEREAAQAKQGETPYRIEPHVRDGPGGLRDLHLAEWLAAVAFPTTRGDVWRQLQRLGVVSRRDAAQAQSAREFLHMVRNWMHFDAGRPADQLVRERQELLAAALGFGDDSSASCVERFMEAYYGHAESVRRVAGFVTERALAERLSLTDELVAVGEDLAPAYPWINVATPGFLVGVAEQFQALGLRPGPELRRIIAEHLDGAGDLGRDPEAAQRFVGLLKAHRGVYETLDLMASLGVLQRLLPELGVACRRVPFDPIHQHTIGHHSLQVVRSLETLRDTEEERLAEFRRVWNEVEAPELLLLAGLLHDIGKIASEGNPPGIPATTSGVRQGPLPRGEGVGGGRGHAVSGARMATAICERLGLDEPETARVAALVRHHLLMSETAQLRDLNQEQTIRDFVAAIGTPDLLNMLLLLTYADIEATGVLTPVKARFLHDLYYRAEAALGEGAAPAWDAERLRRYRTRLSRQLSVTDLAGAHSVGSEQIQAHCEGMPVAYLINTPPDRIAAHIRLAAQVTGSGQPAFEFSDAGAHAGAHEVGSGSGSHITTLTIGTFDAPQPGLLSRLAGALYAHEIAVHAAQVYTRAGEPALALDTLWIDFHGRQLPPTRKIALEQSLRSVLGGEAVDGVLARCRKHLPPALPPHSVRFDHEAAEYHTVLEVDAPDQPGLLYRITRAIASLGWSIHSAKIWTVGDRARDAFYLTDASGERLLEDSAALEERFLEAYLRE